MNDAARAPTALNASTLSCAVHARYPLFKTVPSVVRTIVPQWELWPFQPLPPWRCWVIPGRRSLYCAQSVHCASSGSYDNKKLSGWLYLDNILWCIFWTLSSWAIIGSKHKHWRKPTLGGLCALSEVLNDFCTQHLNFLNSLHFGGL